MSQEDDFSSVINSTEVQEDDLSESDRDEGEPPSPPPDGDVQVATVSNTMDLEVSQLLQQEIEQNQTLAGTDLGTAQQSDPETNEIIRFLCDDTLPDDHTKAKKISAQAQSFALVDGVLFFIDQKSNHCRRCVVPKQLRTQLCVEVSRLHISYCLNSVILYSKVITKHSQIVKQIKL